MKQPTTATNMMQQHNVGGESPPRPPRVTTWRGVDQFVADAVAHLYAEWRRRGGEEPRDGDDRYLRDALEDFFATAGTVRGRR